MATAHVEQDNVALVRRGFEAFAAKDMATLTELFHPDAVWHASPMGVLAGNYDGRDAIFAMFGQLLQETAGTFGSTPLSMAAAGDRVFVANDVRGERKGRSLHGKTVLMFTIASGAVREVHEYHGDYPASATFWG